MAAADLAAGTGLSDVDPHGGVCEEVLDNHIPRYRKNDVIHFDPKSRSHALAINILDCPHPEQRGLVVSHTISIFNKLRESSWGPRLEDILRNALWVLIEQPAATSLLALPKILTNDIYRAGLLSHVENPAVLDFFVHTFNNWTASFCEKAISPVLNKCRAFTTDPLMRAVIGQARSSFNFRWVMDHRKILLCDLAKGSIGDDNSRLLGSLIVLKENLAALSRQDIHGSERVAHVLVCEEAHNFIGDFDSILAEARKYGLILTLATQGIKALPKEASFAIFSNCATVISFRVSGTDAARLSQEFGMAIPASRLQEIPDYTMYVRTLTRSASDSRSPGGTSPTDPHWVNGHPPFPFGRHPQHARHKSVIRVSQARYTRSKAVVEEELRQTFFHASYPRQDFSSSHPK